MEAIVAENASLQKEINILRDLMKRDPVLYKAYFEREVMDALRRTVLFKSSPDEDLRLVGKHMKRMEVPKGQVIHEEDTPTEAMYILVEGEIRRTKMISGVKHSITTTVCDFSVGSLHMSEGAVSFATATCGTDCILYRLDRKDFQHLLNTHPTFAASLVSNLSRMLRRSQTSVRTPLLEQQTAPASIPVTSLASFVESFYRSAMNAWLNSKLVGGNVAALFPNMHIQSTIRVLYINGFKQLRMLFDKIPTDDLTYPKAGRLALACGPGLIMSPVSSMLEANNAGHKNPEPLYNRWRRGFRPRCAREVIFGIGLNQLSDYCEERVPRGVSNKQLRNAFGSMSAGVICAYLSHVPHNLSAMKLMMPATSYPDLWQQLVAQRQADIPNPRLASIAAALAPRGLLIRTTQIVGSFVIINGIIAFCQQYQMRPQTGEVKQPAV
jgi:hypothetical protein